MFYGTPRRPRTSTLERSSCGQAANDTVLGVGAFQRDYFDGGALYLDANRTFYSHFGDRKLITFGGFLKALVRPWKTWSALKAIQARMKSKAIEGNMVGEGLLLGGVLVVDRHGTVVYEFRETTGDPAPIADVDDALDKLA